MVVSTSGGGGALTVDTAETCGLVVPPLPTMLKEELEQADLMPFASIKNPLDLASNLADDFLKAVPIIDQHNVADTILLVFGDPVPDAVDMVKQVSANIRASLAIAYLGGGELQTDSLLEIQSTGVPVFPTPERAVKSLAAVVWDAQKHRKQRSLENMRQNNGEQ
jgi:acyl-CoA synthetase (NDP forming)